MLFYVDVTVVRAAPDERGPVPVAERRWHDTVSCRFAINASSSADAITIATHASQRAIDRDGIFVGGVVKDVTAAATTPDELKNNPYLIKPVDENGIIYVSGITHSSIGYDEVGHIDAELASMRNSITANGLPELSFVHPTFPDKYEPMICRLSCPLCGHWIEFDQKAFFLRYAGLQDSQEWDLQSSIKLYLGFVDRHRACFPGSQNIELDLFWLHHNDDEFSVLDDAKCEGKAGPITKC